MFVHQQMVEQHHGVLPEANRKRKIANVLLPLTENLSCKIGYHVPSKYQITIDVINYFMNVPVFDRSIQQCPLTTEVTRF